MIENQPQRFPQNWRIAQDFNPNDHLMNLKGREYMNVQSRLLWFIRDQRELMISGLAKVPYVIQTDCVELDRGVGFAHFKTFVRDVLGNEVTMYGSESAKDFPDFAEKASTKSLGRALLALGYGTAFAPEMDEGARVVDSPLDRRAPAPRERQANVIREAPAPAPAPRKLAAEASPAAPAVPSPADESEALEKLRFSIRRIAEVLGKPEPENITSVAQAREIRTQLSREYQERQAKRAS